MASLSFPEEVPGEWSTRTDSSILQFHLKITRGKEEGATCWGEGNLLFSFTSQARSKKQPQENTPRPMACSHVGHAATEAHSQQEDTWRPTLQGQVPRCNAK